MKLFEPGKIGKLSVKNRVIMATMNLQLHEPDGRMSQRAIDFFSARARGGVGLILFHCGVEQEIEPRTEGVCHWDPMANALAYVNRLSELADAVHDYGAKLGVQLFEGFGRILPPRLLDVRGLAQPVAPSEQPCLFAPEVTARELAVEEIRKLVDSFGFAAKVASLAGIDLIEIHGQSGYLIDQFMTPLWNHRKDGYGGDLEGRLRFLIEIIEAIKASAGAGFPVICKYSVRHGIEGGREVEESQEIAKRIEAAGVDAINVSAGCYGSLYGRQHPSYGPPGQWVELAEAVKEVVKIPVIAGGRLGDPEIAEGVLEAGKADFISLGRPLLADAEWANKVGEGRVDEVVMCIGCNDGCMQRTRMHKYISCTLNPATGMEREFGEVGVADKKKEVLVIGGGPAGLEAAKVAAQRGHDVTIWERGVELGGNLVAASVPEFKKEVRRLVANLSGQVKELGVKVELGKEATVEMIQQKNAEVVVVATGARHIIPEIAGIEKGAVVTAVDLLRGKKEAGEDVVIAGGGNIGCEVGLHLASEGKKVTIVEMTTELAVELFSDNRTNLIQLLIERGVELITEARVIEITDEGVIVEDRGVRRELKAETVVLALGLEAEAGLVGELEEEGIKAIAIGDCAGPRKIIDAIWEGFRAGRLI